jgi:hypothetical protein
MSAPISKTAVAHDSTVTFGARLPVNESLNELQCGRRCAAVKPIALENPIAMAAKGAQGCRRKTRTSAIAASRNWMMPTSPAS